MRRMTWAAVALAFAFSAPLAAQDLVLTNARIVDPIAETVTSGSIWITDGRIVGTGRDV